MGLRLSAKACFDVRESVAFWDRMNIVSQYEGDIAAEVPEFLSTHPTHESRAKQLEVEIPQVQCVLGLLLHGFARVLVIYQFSLRLFGHNFTELTIF